MPLYRSNIISEAIVYNKTAMSLQKKIINSFLISSVLIAALAIFSYVNFIEIRKDIGHLELSDTLRSKTLQLRRHEKNVFLYRDSKEIESVHSYIGEIQGILDKGISSDKSGRLVDLREQINKYNGTFGRIEKMSADFRQAMEQLRVKNRKYDMFFPLMEATFLDSPSGNAELIQRLFNFSPDTPILEQLRGLDAEIASLRKTGEEIINLSKSLDTETRARVDRVIITSQKALLILFPLFLVVGMAALFLIIHSAAKRLNMLSRALEKTGKGDFSAIPGSSKNDEVGLLIGAFNKMEADLMQRDNEIAKKNEELLQGRKLASLGTLASGVAHELNNPLNNIYLSAQILTKEIGTDNCPGIVRETVEDIYSQTLRVKRIVSDLLAFAREKPPEMAPVKITEVINEILGRMISAGDLRDVRHAVSLDETSTVFADRHMIEQVFINLFTNAIDAMGGKGELDVSAGWEDTAVRVTVSDTGNGIPQEQIQRVFDPFFTTKEHGTGLGLSIVYTIIEKHHGKIELRSSPGKGTTFYITLPGAR